MVDRTFSARFAVDEFVGKLFEEEPLPYWAKLGVVLRHIAAAERTNIDFILDIILLVKLKMFNSNTLCNSSAKAESRNPNITARFCDS